MAVYLLGIDIGTSSCKVTLFKPDGTVVAANGRDYPVRYPRKGWAEQDSRDWWNGVCRAVRDLIGDSWIDPAEIAGIGVDGHSVWREDPGLLSRPCRKRRPYPAGLS